MAIDIQGDLPGKKKDVKALQLVVDSARGLFKLETKITKLEEELKALKSKHLTLSNDTLPALMEQAEIDELPLAGGWKLRRKPIFQANLPAKGTIEDANEEEQQTLLARLGDGLKWLTNNGGVDIIKNKFTADVGRGKIGIAAIAKLNALAKQLKVSADNSTTVHQGALSKFLKEKLEAGTDVPFDTFAIFSGHRAVLEDPKKKASKAANKTAITGQKATKE